MGDFGQDDEVASRPGAGKLHKKIVAGGTIFVEKTIDKFKNFWYNLFVKKERRNEYETQ